MSDSDREGAEYEIEAILASRRRDNGVQEYFIKWSGFPDTDNTWETKKDLVYDGYKAVILAYERKMKAEASSTKKTTPARGARSKTPVKRAVPAVNTTSPVKGKKLDMSETKSSAFMPTVTETNSKALRNLLLASFFLALAVAVAREGSAFATLYASATLNAISPLVVGLVLVRLLGQEDTVIAYTSLTLVWAAFSQVLRSPLVAQSVYLSFFMDFAWRFVFAKAVGATISDRKVVVLSLVIWLLGGDLRHLNQSKILLAIGIWASITSLERWARHLSFLNFLEVGASCALILSCLDPDIEFVWASCLPIVLTAVARARAPAIVQ